MSSVKWRVVVSVTGHVTEQYVNEWVGSEVGDERGKNHRVTQVKEYEDMKE